MCGGSLKNCRTIIKINKSKWATQQGRAQRRPHIGLRPLNPPPPRESSVGVWPKPPPSTPPSQPPCKPAILQIEKGLVNAVLGSSLRWVVDSPKGSQTPSTLSSIHKSHPTDHNSFENKQKNRIIIRPITGHNCSRGASSKLLDKYMGEETKCGNGWPLSLFQTYTKKIQENSLENIIIRRAGALVKDGHFPAGGVLLFGPALLYGRYFLNEHCEWSTLEREGNRWREF